jgi:hypothetical protein
MVELCSRAETGVGPSIAAGSHGCKPNWADFPAAARISPNSKNGRRGVRSSLEESISVKFHELNLRAERAIHVISPISPIRL